MVDDVRHLVDFGVDGIVIGCLDVNGDVDVAACQALIAAAKEPPSRAGKSDGPTPMVRNTVPCYKQFWQSFLLGANYFDLWEACQWFILLF